MIRTLVFLCALASLAAPPVIARAQTTAARGVEPVIVTGAEVPAWSGPAAGVVCLPAIPGQNVRDAHNGTFITPPATGIPVAEIALPVGRNAVRRDPGPGRRALPLLPRQSVLGDLRPVLLEHRLRAHLRVGHRVVEEDRRDVHGTVSAR